jgi:hypothetical protein
VQISGHYFITNIPKVKTRKSIQAYILLLPRSGLVNIFTLLSIVKKKVKAIPVTGREGPKGSETSTVPHFLANRLTDDSKVVSLTRLPPFAPQDDSWIRLVAFCLNQLRYRVPPYNSYYTKFYLLFYMGCETWSLELRFNLRSQQNVIKFEFKTKALHPNHNYI